MHCLQKGLQLFVTACLLAVLLSVGTATLSSQRLFAHTATASDSAVVTLTPSVGKVGDWFQGYGRSWPSNDTVYVYWDNNGPVDQVSPNDNGDFLVYLQGPDYATPSAHTVMFQSTDGWTGQTTTETYTFNVNAS
jgi:hypothetical protein